MNDVSLTERALCIALAAHAQQVRKTDDSPYIVHPVMVALLLARHGFEEPVIAAALVHDVLEDTNVAEGTLRRELGDEIADLVKTVSEDKTLPWEERKRAYIQHVRVGSEGAKAISVADKIHNLQSLLAGHAQQGSSVWEKFNRGKEEKLWFEREMLRALQENWHHPLVDEYARSVERMAALD